MSGYLLQQWSIKGNDRIGSGKLQNLIKTSRGSTPNANSDPSSIPPISDSFLHIETSGNNYGENFYCTFVRTDITHISNIGFCRNGLSTGDNQAVGFFRIQLLLADNTWSARYNVPKSDCYSTSTQWISVNLNFTMENYDIKPNYDGINSSVADMSYSNFSITHAVY